MRTIIFNGPPSSGKDTLGNALCELLNQEGSPLYPVCTLEFKSKLYENTAHYYDIDEVVLRAAHAKDKVKPRAWLGGLNTRQALIYTSEECMKPTYGQDYYGVAAANAMAEVGIVLGVKCVIFTDSGFPLEIKPVAQACQEIIVIRLYRKGCTYACDSRNYLLAENLPAGIRMIDWTNSEANSPEHHALELFTTINAIWGLD